VEAAAGTLPGMVRTGATVADACAEYLRYVDQDRQRKPSTIRDYDSIFRNHVLPHLGDIALEDLTAVGQAVLGSPDGATLALVAEDVTRDRLCGHHDV
jgi:hypothetical protein